MGQRAEIFEITVNQVPVFRITLPDEEFRTLKRKAILIEPTEIVRYNNVIKKIISIINEQNFYELFPGSNFKEILPELPFGEDGHPTLDYGNYIIGTNKNLDKILHCGGSKRMFFIPFTIKIYLLKWMFILIDEFGKCMGINEEGKFYDIEAQNAEEDEDDKIGKEIESIHDYFGYNYTYEEPSNIFGVLIPDEYSDDDTSEYPSSTDNYELPSISDFDDPSNKKSWDFHDFHERYFFHRKKVINDEESTDFIDQSEEYTYDEVEDYDRKYDDYTPEDFESLFRNYDFDKNYNIDFSFNGKDKDFKTKNATLTVEINNEKKEFDKVTFSLGGSYSRSFARPGYNLKIRGKKDLYGRRQFKLRADASEPTYMRTKLISDIHNRLGIPSLSANYATLYINNEYMGLFIFTDVYKESWIEYVYGEKDTSLLYKCNKCDLTYDTRHGFENENKEATNKKELYEFLSKMTTAKSASDVESFFDLDQFYKEIAIDLLTSSWDHFNSKHNYYIYKYKDKWIYLSQDFDLDMGEGGSPSMKIEDRDDNIIIKKLILNDDRRFNEILKEIVEKAFNPATLFPRIDELKSFIRPYVKLDKTPNENGEYPGRLNKNASEFYSFQQWEDTTEFKDLDWNNYALKKFILIKYRVICKRYNMECDPIYIDRHYGMKNNNSNNNNNNNNSNSNNTSGNESSDKKYIVQNETEINHDDISSSSDQNTIISSSSNNDTAVDNTIDHTIDNIDNAVFTNYNEDISSNTNEEQCWSEKFGYPCCTGCEVQESDSNGEWGFELDQWCGILPSRCAN
eukprot:jgi/Orpsp1_1/1176240/evm.model.c7180000056922.1